MVRRVVWTTAALDELREVADYVARSDAQEARHIVAEALAQADGRPDFAESGSIVAELNSESVREVIVKRAFRLVYELSDSQITILAFIRARKRLTRSSIQARRPSG